MLYCVFEKRTYLITLVDQAIQFFDLFLLQVFFLVMIIGWNILFNITVFLWFGLSLFDFPEHPKKCPLFYILILNFHIVFFFGFIRNLFFTKELSFSCLVNSYDCHIIFFSLFSSLRKELFILLIWTEEHWCSFTDWLPHFLPNFLVKSQCFHIFWLIIKSNWTLDCVSKWDIILFKHTSSACSFLFLRNRERTCMISERVIQALYDFRQHSGFIIAGVVDRIWRPKEKCIFSTRMYMEIVE